MNEDRDDQGLPGEAEAAVPQDRRVQAKERQRQMEAERRARAAEKLRENLARRKQQARARRSGDADETDGLPAAKRDESS